MYDGWTHDNTHYIGVFAVYMKKIRVFRNNEESFVEQLAIPLLSASPIGQYVEEYDTESLPFQETTEFNSTADVRQLESVFNYFHLNVYEWAVCQIADNCSTNRRIAKLMELPHVGCLSHKLHLDINDMITKDKRLETVIESIHRTIKSCKTSLVNPSLSRNVTSLSPVIHNKTRWSGKYHMLRRYIKIRNSIIEADSCEDSTIEMNKSDCCIRQAEYYEKLLEYFDIATNEIQKRNATLHDCRCVTDSLIEIIDSKTDEPDSVLFNCKFKQTRRSLHGSLSPDSSFESGVAKIQSKGIGLMTDREKAACSRLKYSDLNESTMQEEQDVSSTFREAIFKKRRRFNKARHSYINCNFILGTTAEIERLWSVAKNILSTNRKAMEPLLFEAILFLKTNHSYWDLDAVQLAMTSPNEDREVS